MKNSTPLLFLCLCCYSSVASVKLPRLVSDGMILQRRIPVKIWGWASPGEKVQVLFKTRSYPVKADSQGNWEIRIPPQEAGGPYQLKIKGQNQLVVNDILIGDVWLCSGQSNMELTMERLKYKYADEIKQAGNAFIRQFTVPDKYNLEAPEKDLDGGSWQPLNSGTIMQFSAVAYFFAKEIYANYKVPIGLINAALGGSPAEAWISPEALRKFPVPYEEAIRFRNRSLIAEIESKDQAVSKAWQQQLDDSDLGLKEQWAEAGFHEEGWDEMDIPGYWASTRTGPVNGAVWFRKVVTLPPSFTGKPVKLELGRIVDADMVFINGRQVGSTSYQYPPRRYEIPAGILTEGNNTIVIRVISQSGNGGFVPGKLYQLTAGTDTIRLDNSWKYRTGAVMQPIPGQTFIRWKPTGLYHAMIAPLHRYAIKGVLWYQGESNTSRPGEYREMMQTLITDWRARWKQGDFPFLYVQLPGFMEAREIPGESNWALLRQQQLNTLSVPRTAMAVAIDAGEWNDIHPENKKDIGLRLALLAKRLAYGNSSIVASGPLYRSSQIKGDTIVIDFSEQGSGLVPKGDAVLKEFAIAGPDKKYVWANAIIAGNKVKVWSHQVKNPVAVRYAWADNPDKANLYNKENLPASPFTTEK